MLRQELLGDLKLAAKRGVVPPKRLSEVSQLVGFRNVTSDLGILVRVARGRCRSSRSARTSRPPSSIARSGFEAALWHAISASEGMPTSTSTASRERVRALTLLSQAYDELCRIVEFLRWDEGDAETIAPSMYGFPRTTLAAEEGCGGGGGGERGAGGSALVVAGAFA